MFLEEVGEIDRKVVFGVLLHFRVENDDALQRPGDGDDAERRVILLLLSDEEEADVRVVQHLGHLCAAAGGIEGDGDHSDAVGSEIDEVCFRFVLGEDSDVLLHLHPGVEQGERDVFHFLGKGVPRDVHPFVKVIVTVTQCRSVSIFLCLCGNQFGEVTFGLHSVPVLEVREFESLPLV